MDLFDVARTCARRWYIFLPLMMIVAWVGYSTYSGVQPVNYGSTTLGLTPPSVTEPEIGAVHRNALLDVGGAPLLANLLAIGLKDPLVVRQVVEGGGLPDYTAKVMEFAPPVGQVPLVMIEVTAADPVAVKKTLELVAGQAEPTLRNLQQSAGVPPDRMAAPFPVQPPTDPVQGMPSRIRATVALFVVGAGLAVLVTVLVDLVLLRREKHRATRVPRSSSG
ncbi:hypothetical protein [Rhodococcus sp. NPDC058514]|uniref:hypothetical protein n=1 Tax=unclassified Rhodococcus (in: high G+C Gram-positive bacteria) TaxID=192944 RepID=UPI00365DF6CB